MYNYYENMEKELIYSYYIRIVDEIKPYEKITIKNSVEIINTSNNTYVIKKKTNKNLDYIYDYLTSWYNYYSAYSLVRDLLYQYTNYNETISLSTLPVYYLDTNVRITVKDIESGIDGDYMVDSISIPLDSSSLMSINATKAWEKL